MVGVQELLHNRNLYTRFFEYAILNSQFKVLNLAFVLFYIICSILLPAFLSIPFIIIGLSPIKYIIIFNFLIVLVSIALSLKYLSTLHGVDDLPVLEREQLNEARGRIGTFVIMVIVFRLFSSFTYNFMYLEFASFDSVVSVKLVGGAVLLIIKPIAVEMFFRGTVLQHLENGFQPRVSVPLSSLIYTAYMTLLYFPDTSTGFLYSFFTFTIQGLVIGHVYRTDGLQSAILLHYLIDVFIIIYLIVV